jgi:hypothetical protein
MAEPVAQNFVNHRRFDPWYHVFAFGVFAVAILLSLWTLVRTPSWPAAGCFVWSVAVMVLLFRARSYPLKAQDRIIRLEERMRLTTLLAEPLRSRISELTESQLIGLRFASDGEVAGLVQAALDEKLTGEQIKKRIKTWRPDNYRV